MSAPQENEFRRRILAPVLMLLGLVVGVGLVAFSISRVLLTVPEIVATFTALAIAGYVLLLAVMVGKRPRISSRALGAGLVVGLVALLGAGIVSAQAGMRDLHEGEEGGEVADGEEGSEGGGAAAFPPGTAAWVAIDIDYEEAPESVPAGEVVIGLDNQGVSIHNVVIPDADVKVEAGPGEQATDTVTLEPGTYLYYCDVPGHRPAMEGELTVE